MRAIYAGCRRLQANGLGCNLYCRDSILPWPVLKEMLRRIQNVKSKDEYLKMWWDGDTVLDILPGGILQRTLTVVELFAQDRYALANRTGKALAHMLVTFVTMLVNCSSRACCSTSEAKLFSEPARNPRHRLFFGA